MMMKSLLTFFPLFITLTTTALIFLRTVCPVSGKVLPRSVGGDYLSVQEWPAIGEPEQEQPKNPPQFNDLVESTLKSTREDLLKREQQKKTLVNAYIFLLTYGLYAVCCGLPLLICAWALTCKIMACGLSHPRRRLMLQPLIFVPDGTHQVSLEPTATNTTTTTTS